MAEPKHQCGTCWFFQNAQMTGNGWCTHPARQPDSDVKILVRERELACRNTWGDDLWADASSPATTPSDQGQPRRSFTYLTPKLDDEVTSVVDTSARNTTPPVVDDVVTMTSVRPDDAVTSRPNNDVNSLAVADQEERARVMAQGNRHAILSARKRHAQRWSERQTSPVADDEDVVAQADVTPDPEPDTTDDHVEMPATITGPGDAPAASSPAPHQTSVASDVGLPRLRSFLRGAEAAPPAEVPADAPPRSHFDHVMRQAERIREQTAASRPAQPEPAAPSEPVDTLPTTPEPAGEDQAEVVWDVDPASLDVAFARARAAIEQPRPEPAPQSLTANQAPHRQPETAEESQVFPEELADTDDWYPESDPLDDMEPASEPIDHGDFTDHHAPLAAVHTESDDDDWVDDSPRSSWWRSLNFGLRHRFQTHATVTPAHAAEDAYDEYHEEEEKDWGYRDDDVHAERSPTQDVAAGWDDDQWEQPPAKPLIATPARDQAHPEMESWAEAEESWEPEDDMVAYWAEPSASDDREWAAGPTESSQYVTSQESWVLDEREFPEPPPPEWRPMREALLASLPPIESLDDSVEWIAATPQAPAAEPQSVHRPLPERRAFMDIDTTGGMDAFRAALFDQARGRNSEPAGRQALAAEPESWLPYPSEQPRPSRRPEPTAGTSRQGSDSRSDRQPKSPGSTSAHRRYREAMRWEEETTYDDPYDEVHDEPLPRAARTPAPSPSPRRDDLASLPVVNSNDQMDKRCLTCRSYSPSDDRSRGWCTNEWSSAHRAVVNADELACRSSMGDWWIAADATWIPPEDIIRPGTPRTEQMLRDPDEEKAQERQRARRQHVRTRNVG